MKQIRHVSAILILVVTASFQPSLAQPDGGGSQYFPLRIGNKWSYSSEAFGATRIIHDTLRIGGKLYYAMGWSVSSSFILFRSSHDSVFVLNELNDSTESVLYNLNANVGDTVEMSHDFDCSFGTRIILASKEATVTTPSGTYDHCYHFQHVPNCADAGMLDSWLAEGIGIIKYNEVYIFGSLTFLLDSSRIVTSVRCSGADVEHMAYFLSNTYPNPFNPQTSLEYRLDKGGHVSLRIVDLLGREIATLVNEKKAPGLYKVEWNAEREPSGMYFAVFSAGGHMISRRLVLLR